MKKRNIFLNFSNHILGFPLWIKQIVFLKLKEDLENSLSEDLNIINKDDLFQLYSPVISFKGEKELETREHELSQNLYTFLAAVASRLSLARSTILSISVFWMISGGDSTHRWPRGRRIKPRSWQWRSTRPQKRPAKKE